MRPQYEMATCIAVQGQREGRTITAPDLVKALTILGFRAENGASYDAQGRGIYRVLAAAWNELTNAGRHAEADAIAKVFTRPNGTYAYAA